VAREATRPDTLLRRFLQREEGQLRAPSAGSREEGEEKEAAATAPGRQTPAGSEKRASRTNMRTRVTGRAAPVT